MTIARLAFNTGDVDCRYGAYSFGPYARTTAFSIRPQPDPAKRTVATSVWSLTIEDYIEPDGGGPDGTANTTDSLVEEAIAELSKNAQLFYYQGRGFGNITVNIGGQRDVDFGPWPREVMCENVGLGYVTKIKWTVEWSMPTCDDAKYRGVKSFVYKVNYELDRAGYCTRRYEASLEIAGTKAGANNTALPDAADDYREQTVPELPVGFRRESQNFGLSLDKRTLTTSVVDVQMPPEPPPKGCVEAYFDHTVSTQGNAYLWSANFSGEYDLDRNNGVAADAVAAFVETVKRRQDDAIGELRSIPNVRDQNGAVTTGAPPTFKAVSATASDPNVYGRQKVKLSVSFIMVGAFEFGAMVGKSGLWTPINSKDENDKYQTWATSISSAWRPLGIAKLRFRKEDDKIVSLCGGNTSTVNAPPTVGGRTPDPSQSGSGGTPAQGTGGALSTLFGNIGGAVATSLATSPPTAPPTSPPPSAGGQVSALISNTGSYGGGLTGLLARVAASMFAPSTPESSWIKVRMDLTTKADTGRVVGVTLPTAPIDPTKAEGTPWNALLPGLPTVGNPSHPFPALAHQLSFPQAGATFVQQRTKPTLYVTLSGYALRAGFEIPIPELIEINGTTPVLVGEPWFRQGVVGETLSGPVYRAEWSLTYVITDDGTFGNENPYRDPIHPPRTGLMS